MRRFRDGFSLVEVVLAIGVVSFAVVTTFGLLSVASNTDKNARDEQSAARLAANEFNRIRSLGASTFPNTYDPRYYDSDLSDLGKVKDYVATAHSTAPAYMVSLFFVAPAAPQPADWVVNAEVAFPALAPAQNQQKFRFSTLMNQPLTTPTPSPTP